MFYIVDFFNSEMPNFITDEDGNVLKFDTREEAEEEAVGVQEPLVIEY